MNATPFLAALYFFLSIFLILAITPSVINVHCCVLNSIYCVKEMCDFY